jgi:hypothetical protein
MGRPGAEGVATSSGLDPIKPLRAPNRAPADCNDTVRRQLSGERYICECASLMKRLANCRAKLPLVLRGRLRGVEDGGVDPCRHRSEREQSMQPFVVDMTASDLVGQLGQPRCQRCRNLPMGLMEDRISPLLDRVRHGNRVSHFPRARVDSARSAHDGRTARGYRIVDGLSVLPPLPLWSADMKGFRATRAPRSRRSASTDRDLVVGPGVRPGIGQ